MNILCHYTFHSNELNPFVALLMLVFMAIIFIFAIRIWIENKVDNHKLNKEIKNREDYLITEANHILKSEESTNSKVHQIINNYNWKKWFEKGYIEGSTYGNEYFASGMKCKPRLEYTTEEWERHQILKMEHIKPDSGYFGGNKDIAISAFFLGHKYGLKRFLSKGAANL